MRLAFGAISHETNTFSRLPTTLREFRQHQFAEGDDVFALYAGSGTPLGGFIDAARGRVDLLPTIAAAAVPSGVVTEDALAELTNRLVTRLAGARRSIDGVLLHLHGAMVSEVADDGESYVLRRVREAIGPTMPIAVVLDSHANLTEDTLRLADILVGYDTYPHVDMHARGAEALELLLGVLEQRFAPVKALRRLPLISPVNGQRTGREPMLSLMKMAAGFERQPGILNVTVAPGFPYSDVSFSGFSVVVTSNGDETLANDVADRLSAAIWAHRGEFQVSAWNVEEAVHRAMAAPRGPVVLADQGDNPGAGGPADGTALLWALLDLGARDAAFALIADANAVASAIEAGVGATLDVSLGGKLDRRAGYPIDVHARVERLTDGKLVMEGPMSSGLRVDLGPTAVLRASGRHGGDIEIIVTARATQPYDLAFFRSQGIEPTRKKILAVKSSVHFRAGFESIAAEILEVATPGITTTDLGFFDFRRLRRPIYPLDNL